MKGDLISIRKAALLEVLETVVILQKDLNSLKRSLDGRLEDAEKPDR